MRFYFTEQGRGAKATSPEADPSPQPSPQPDSAAEVHRVGERVAEPGEGTLPLKLRTAGLLLAILSLGWLGQAGEREPSAAPEAPRLQFKARNAAEARQWQREARARLFGLLTGGSRPEKGLLRPQVVRELEVTNGGYRLEELTLQTLPDRTVHVWVASPREVKTKVGAVLALHGHGGTGQQIVRGEGLYWYGRALVEMGYVVAAPDIGQHDLQHTNWSLMGERVWDALRCVDYLVTRPEVDTNRLAVAGLSLGGETTMYVAALDERIRLTCSSGWLTTVANMKQGHCPCWNFPGLEEHFDFSDIFALVAPRPLVLELGEQERAPGGFPVAIGRSAYKRIQDAYQTFKSGPAAVLSIHPGGHVFGGRDFWPLVQRELGEASPWRGQTESGLEECRRRGEIARRNFARASGVLDRWWRTRDPVTGLFPRRLDQPVWAPNDNAADLLPFLALTAYYLAPSRLEEVLRVISIERTLTTRWAGLPDWYGLTNRAFVHSEADPRRLIFGAAEYCKDGLLPLTEVMGRGLWTDRMEELLAAIFDQAPCRSDFGNLPADDTETNGDLLQVLSRMYWLTRDQRYLDWALRLGDAYCLEVLPRSRFLPPHRWDFVGHRALVDEFNLNDHGNEIVGGLSELLVAAQAGNPRKARAYRRSLAAMAKRLLNEGRNPDGLWVQRIRPSTGEVLDPNPPDTWGYAMTGIVTLGLALNQNRGAAAARTALRHLDQGRYLVWNGADAYADSLEGGLLLLNRFPEPNGWRWFEHVLPLFLGKPREDGLVEGWYGDGNYARTALMAGLYYTQGFRAEPWTPRLRFGALSEKGGVRLAVEADEAWTGRLVPDQPRHRVHLRLPYNYPRLNEFPEWFTVTDDQRYDLALDDRPPERLTGAQLREGIFVEVKPREARQIRVRESRSQ